EPVPLARYRRESAGRMEPKMRWEGRLPSERDSEPGLLPVSPSVSQGCDRSTAVGCLARSLDGRVVLATPPQPSLGPRDAQSPSRTRIEKAFGALTGHPASARMWPHARGYALVRN